MSATWVTFLFEAANFLLLAALLGWLFFRPVRDALERRRSEIEAERQAAVQAREEAQRALEQAREHRAELEASIEALREKARREAEAQRERLLEAAREQARRERQALEEELSSLRRAEARERVRDAVFAARELVVRLLEAVGGPELETALVASACRQLEELRAAGPLSPILVSSARPLEPEVLHRLAQAAGVAAEQLAPRVEPDLVAGVRVVTGRGLVDRSAAGLADRAETLLLGRLERETESEEQRAS